MSDSVNEGISIHALREEGDAADCKPQIRLPISIHALREEGDVQPGNQGAVILTISIHALREEGDQPYVDVVDARHLFLSTPSARRATASPVRKDGTKHISIHALREEGDFDLLSKTVLIRVISIHALREEGDRRPQDDRQTAANFYPRPPRGGRQRVDYEMDKVIQFLSTPSARRATPAGGGGGGSTTDFYPRPPRGGRRRSAPTMSTRS